MSEQFDDPFADAEKAPSLSFKDTPVGTSYTGTVTKKPSVVQARDFDTGELAEWPDGNPKMTVVTNLTVNGEERSLWAPKPSAMFHAIAKAQKDAGTLIDVGGTLTVKFVGEKKNPDKPRLAPQKLYEVTYAPPAANAFSDAATASDEPPF